MTKLKVSQIIDAIESVAPLYYQEEWDNSGLQIGDADSVCTGVLLCVDVTSEIIDEAKNRNCNLIISHHPLLFKGVKQIVGRNRVQRVIAKAIKEDIAIYSSHTSMDNAPKGVSYAMSKMLDLENCKILLPLKGDSDAGCGMTGNTKIPLTPIELVEKVKSTFDSPVTRCSRVPEDGTLISCVALCGGSGADFIPAAIDKGAQAYITSDSKLNWFLDYDDDIFLIDIGHYESEKCTKRIFYHILSEKFPNFAVYFSESEKNPINYL